MLSEEEMLSIAEQYISFEGEEIEIVLLESYTIRKPYGNIYYYNSKEYIETGEDRYSLIGNAPFLVEKETGRVVSFGTAQSLDYYIEAYENGTLVPSLDRYWYPDEERYDYK